MRIELRVNGEPREADVHGAESLLFVLRERLDLVGAKGACEEGECGSCSVLLDGQLVCAASCTARRPTGATSSRSRAWRRTAGCTRCRGHSSRGRRAVRLLHARPRGRDGGAARARARQPSDDDIREALSGNLCRCTGYGRIFEAVRIAAAELRA